MESAAVSDVLLPYQVAPMAVGQIRQGLAASAAKTFFLQLGLPLGSLLAALALSPATFNRKLAKGDRLAPDESERVLGLMAMADSVTAMLDGAAGFDHLAWLARWLTVPVPALGDVRPLDYLDTMTGQRMVQDLLLRMETGAYS
jgi:putative toxin-antitoxin system antitoxin component (TIGR02293 family)